MPVASVEGVLGAFALGLGLTTADLSENGEANCDAATASEPPTQ